MVTAADQLVGEIGRVVGDEGEAVRGGVEKLFVLTTRTAHWFRERGFLPGDISHLPARKQSLYNYQRKSRVYIKSLEGARDSR